MSCIKCCITADGRSGPAVLAACAARRSLVRRAASVNFITNQIGAVPAACASLVCCLPALETVQLTLYLPLLRDLGCLLEALAWCPRLQNVWLGIVRFDTHKEDLSCPFPAPALANLGSLTSLAWYFDDQVPYTLVDIVGALVAMTGLAELHFGSPKPAMVPAALGHLKGLRALKFLKMRPSGLEVGCLDLPNLQSLDFVWCILRDAEVLPGVSALQRLTRVEFEGGETPVAIVHQLVQLPRLQRLVLSHSPHLSPPGVLRLPADMGALRLGLLHLDLQDRKLTQFPLALTQLVALEHLNASNNEFAELPAGITALSRLTVLMLGRRYDSNDPYQRLQKPPLDVRALGDLSGFPALCELTFEICEVMLCRSVLAAARHTSLTSICFYVAHPAPESAPAVLQLHQVLTRLWRLRRGSNLKLVMQ